MRATKATKDHGKDMDRHFREGWNDLVKLYEKMGWKDLHYFLLKLQELEEIKGYRLVKKES